MALSGFQTSWVICASILPTIANLLVRAKLFLLLNTLCYLLNGPEQSNPSIGEIQNVVLLIPDFKAPYETLQTDWIKMKEMIFG